MPVLALDAMDEVLLADRFSAALAEAPVVSCAVPLPPTMPAVKFSSTGLPIPVQKVGGGPLFGHAPRPASAGAKAAEQADMAEHLKSEYVQEERRELSELDARAHQLGRSYNRLVQMAAAKEARLEELQLQAELSARDTLDADDELQYAHGTHMDHPPIWTALPMGPTTIHGPLTW